MRGGTEGESVPDLVSGSPENRKMEGELYKMTLPEN